MNGGSERDAAGVGGAHSWRELHTNIARRHQQLSPPTISAASPPHPSKKSPKPPPLPANDYKIIVRIRGGLDCSKIHSCVLRQIILKAAGLPINEHTAQDQLRVNEISNTILVSTPNMDRADSYNTIRTLNFNGTTYEVATHVADPSDTCRGVILLPTDSPEQAILPTLIATILTSQSQQAPSFPAIDAAQARARSSSKTPGPHSTSQGEAWPALQPPPPPLSKQATPQPQPSNLETSLLRENATLKEEIRQLKLSLQSTQPPSPSQPYTLPSSQPLTPSLPSPTPTSNKPPSPMDVAPESRPPTTPSPPNKRKTPDTPRTEDRLDDTLLGFKNRITTLESKAHQLQDFMAFQQSCTAQFVALNDNLDRFLEPVMAQLATLTQAITPPPTNSPPALPSDEKHLPPARRFSIPHYIGIPNPDLATPITEAEVRHALANLRTTSAPGPDQINNKILRNLDDNSEAAIALAFTIPNSSIIVSDSKTAISNFGAGRVSRQALSLTLSRPPTQDIGLIWTPAHAGLAGNEVAHASARGLTDRARALGLTTLKSLSTTRWACRAEAIKAVRDNYCALVDSVEEIMKNTQHSETRAKAKALLAQLESFEFQFCMEIAHPVLQMVLKISRMLHDPKINLLTAFQTVKNLQEALKEMRLDESAFTKVFQGPTEICQTRGISIPAVTEESV
ncbi:hypothetical protein HPB49_015241 [Dermacentor silvarum]|uniref:Uncharacterized protein n=1 Tax=Dermacentor silvarum TaxID=543639 RepID=A0ACB8E0U6_DERSI|nr:hypothetical protein HPB49_015241 [Dermacentor silvarum]